MKRTDDKPREEGTGPLGAVIQFWLADDALEEFGAPGVSALTTCNVPRLSHATAMLLGFSSSNCVLSGNAPVIERQLILNAVRRVCISYEEHERARLAVYTYVDGQRKNTLRYFEAVASFETFISQLYQAHMLKQALLKRKGMLKRRKFVPGERSLLDRLGKLYNRCKHLEGAVVNRRLDASTVLPFTITLTGLKNNVDGVELSFIELAQFL